MSHSPVKGALRDRRAMQLAQQHGVDVAQLLLRYSLQRGFVVVFGSTTAAHVRSNLHAFSFELSMAEVLEIACWRGCANDGESRHLSGTVGRQLRDEARRHMQADTHARHLGVRRSGMVPLAEVSDLVRIAPGCSPPPP